MKDHYSHFNYHAIEYHSYLQQHWRKEQNIIILLYEIHDCTLARSWRENTDDRLNRLNKCIFDVYKIYFHSCSSFILLCFECITASHYPLPESQDDRGMTQTQVSTNRHILFRPIEFLSWNSMWRLQSFHGYHVCYAEFAIDVHRMIHGFQMMHVSIQFVEVVKMIGLHVMLSVDFYYFSSSSSLCPPHWFITGALTLLSLSALLSIKCSLNWSLEVLSDSNQHEQRGWKHPHINTASPTFQNFPSDQDDTTHYVVEQPKDLKIPELFFFLPPKHNPTHWQWNRHRI